MKQLMILAAVVMLAVPAMADTFGTGDNQFTIEFVPISANPGETRTTNTSGQTVQTFTNGTVGPWTDPGYNYRMGKYEITNDQWNKFVNVHGKPKGKPSNAYDDNPYWTGTDVPTNNVSWYEAAQFVNWLNTSNGYQAAYKFTDSSFTVWNMTDPGYDASNPFRNRNAKYFMPTEDEWVKAAYWNGANLQTYATKAGESLYQGNGSNGGWNYRRTDLPWNVGSGSEELNGTFDMMGNVWEWMETPYYSGDFLPGSARGNRGGSCDYYGLGDAYLISSYRDVINPFYEGNHAGFRVASIPEPMTLLLLGLGGLFIRKR